MKHTILIFIFFLSISTFAPAETITIVNVIDSKTLKLSTGETVKLLGIQNFSDEKIEKLAVKLIKTLISNETEVKLVFDVDSHNHDGFLQSYVYIKSVCKGNGLVSEILHGEHVLHEKSHKQDIFLNSTLIKQGLAIPDLEGVSPMYAKLFKQLYSTKNRSISEVAFVEKKEKQTVVAKSKTFQKKSSNKEDLLQVAILENKFQIKIGGLQKEILFLNEKIKESTQITTAATLKEQEVNNQFSIVSMEKELLLEENNELKNSLNKESRNKNTITQANLDEKREMLKSNEKEIQKIKEMLNEKEGLLALEKSKINKVSQENEDFSKRIFELEKQIQNNKLVKSNKNTRMEQQQVALLENKFQMQIDGLQKEILFLNEKIKESTQITTAATLKEQEVNNQFNIVSMEKESLLKEINELKNSLNKESRNKNTITQANLDEKREMLKNNEKKITRLEQNLEKFKETSAQQRKIRENNLATTTKENTYLSNKIQELVFESTKELEIHEKLVSFTKTQSQKEIQKIKEILNEKEGLLASERNKINKVSQENENFSKRIFELEKQINNKKLVRSNKIIHIEQQLIKKDIMIEELQINSNKVKISLNDLSIKREQIEYESKEHQKQISLLLKEEAKHKEILFSKKELESNLSSKNLKIFQLSEKINRLSKQSSNTKKLTKKYKEIKSTSTALNKQVKAQEGIISKLIEEKSENQKNLDSLRNEKNKLSNDFDLTMKQLVKYKTPTSPINYKKEKKLTEKMLTLNQSLEVKNQQIKLQASLINELKADFENLQANYRYKDRLSQDFALSIDNTENMHNVGKSYTPNKVVLNKGKINRKYYQNGNIKKETIIENGKKHGFQRFFYENGNVFIENNYQHGKLDGIKKMYSSNGTLTDTALYVDGNLVSIKKYN
jgi:DNA repair exonuclease SbcCD ATPase subunit